MGKIVRQFKSFVMCASLGTCAAIMAVSVLSTAGQAQTSGKHGKELFDKRCGGCHALDRDKEGPRLAGVYGRAAASIASFDYSAGLKNSHITWTDETLEKWLADPEKLVPDNDMTFHVQSAEERREIIAFLKQNSGK
jgi:cytochrome c